jgi:hypothetical protein
VYPNQVAVYPNPLVADLMAVGIANRIVLLNEYRAELNAGVLDALARLERELDHLAGALKASRELLDARSLGYAQPSRRIR